MLDCCSRSLTCYRLHSFIFAEVQTSQWHCWLSSIAQKSVYRWEMQVATYRSVEALNRTEWLTTQIVDCFKWNTLSRITSSAVWLINKTSYVVWERTAPFWHTLSLQPLLMHACFFKPMRLSLNYFFSLYLLIMCTKHACRLSSAFISELEGLILNKTLRVIRASFEVVFRVPYWKSMLNSSRLIAVTSQHNNILSKSENLRFYSKTSTERNILHHSH